ncbi:uncharacterized protein FIBRA_09320 [Fibroporia radiculosa]|uniref:Uncharacterized protein n=1 Tax=Fibroporia radiculosa TaxID=599839 RepID=J7RHE0_9APHY|nr:uncharacterized protein FIBRA_09320 [Fibroporia radiculosa]CCM07002.1 predicted protein [Fibroporia radiculosa]
MASTTILTAFLILAWFLFALLVLILTIAFHYLKATYKVEIILTRQPTTPTIDLTPEWPTGAQVNSPDPLVPTPFTDLFSDSPMASTTILAAFLILAWFLFALLILILTIVFYYLKATYKVEIVLTRQPTTPTVDLTPEWPTGAQW